MIYDVVMFRCLLVNSKKVQIHNMKVIGVNLHETHKLRRGYIVKGIWIFLIKQHIENDAPDACFPY